jgi:hypothetical protein
MKGASLSFARDEVSVNTRRGKESHPFGITTINKIYYNSYDDIAPRLFIELISKTYHSPQFTNYEW